MGKVIELRNVVNGVERIVKHPIVSCNCENGGVYVSRIGLMLDRNAFVVKKGANSLQTRACLEHTSIRPFEAIVVQIQLFQRSELTNILVGDLRNLILPHREPLERL